MALLNRTKCRDRHRILESFYPFNEPRRIEGMIIGNDVDALLSASLLKERYGWDVVAIYDYQKLWIDQMFAGNWIEKCKSGVWLAVDLDIYRNRVPSIGHHILQLTPNDRLVRHEQSLNPNLIMGVDCGQFRKKYPLGTVHFLRWLFETEIDRPAEMLCWLADSAYINAQSHRFRKNVSHWLYNFFDWPPFWEIFILLDSADYEDMLIRDIGNRLRNLTRGLAPGQVRSRHRALSGWQCQWQDPQQQSDDIHNILTFIHELCGWESPVIPRHFFRIDGQRDRLSVSEVLKMHTDLDDFLEKTGVFSYVFTHIGRLNVTRFPAESVKID